MLQPQKMHSMFVTDETSQFPMGWLKYFALRNIRYIVVTCDVSHVSSPSKSVRFESQNSQLISVIRDVSMSPRQTVSLFTSSLSSFKLPGLYSLLIIMFHIFVNTNRKVHHWLTEQCTHKKIFKGRKESRINQLNKLNLGFLNSKGLSGYDCGKISLFS